MKKQIATSRVLVRLFCRVGMCVWLAALVLALPAHGREPVKHVIVISVDGLVPEYFLPGERGDTLCPAMTRMREEGALVKSMMPPYPSLTYPGHATIATGVHPARHGIVGNGLFEPTAQVHRGAWFARDMQTPAIWDITRAAKLTAAAVLWPVSAQARGLRWNLPEFWSSPYGSEISLVRRYARPGSLLIELEEKLDGTLFHYLQPADRRDQLAAVAALDIFQRYKPNLLLIHFVETDKIQHRRGRAAPEADPVFATVDKYIGQIRDLVRSEGLEDETVVMVLGDHGFADVDRSIGPNVELVDHGLISVDEDGEIESWVAIVNNSGNSAGVYLADDADEADLERVREVLENFSVDAEGRRLYRILEQEEIRQVGGPADAVLYLEGAPGVMFTGSINRAFRDRRSSLRGNHGGHPHDPQMHTGLLVVGPGIRAGAQLKQGHLTDVAPTIAALFGLEFPDVDGRVLEELFE